MKTRTIRRSARTGKMVSRDYADANPDETTTETRRQSMPMTDGLEKQLRKRLRWLQRATPAQYAGTRHRSIEMIDRRIAALQQERSRLLQAEKAKQKEAEDISALLEDRKV